VLHKDMKNLGVGDEEEDSNYRWLESENSRVSQSHDKPR
jgi:hypothetical protein